MARVAMAATAKRNFIEEQLLAAGAAVTDRWTARSGDGKRAL
jgi:hypothetical protein